MWDIDMWDIDMWDIDMWDIDKSCTFFSGNCSVIFASLLKTTLRDYRDNIINLSIYPYWIYVCVCIHM